MTRHFEDYDVVVIGFGPVGKVVASLIARQGHRVAVFDRWTGMYPLPRACVVDGEAMNLLHQLGIAEEFESVAVPTEGYTWWNGKGDILLQMKRANEEMAGWRARYMMYQPDLEALLDRAARETETLHVFQGWQAIELSQDPDGVSIELESFGQAGPTCRHRVRAGYAIGADGANSFVREKSGIAWEDLGFDAEWLVVDFRPHDPNVAIDMPLAGQLCDPARPVSLFRRLGPAHCRWELMLLPGEERAQMEHPDTVWRLLSRWVTPQDGNLVRSTVYEFRSRVATRWSDRRVLLAGDSAHLMPPFLGQGMCTGLRDAANLAWRLDLVLRGISSPELLASYEVERKRHATAVIDLAVRLGRILCELDPHRAEARDAAILSGNHPKLPPFPKLEGGLIAEAGTLLAGELAPQFRISEGRREARFDDIAGRGWRIVTCTPGMVEQLPADLIDDCRSFGARFITLGLQGTQAPLVDTTGYYAAFFETAHIVAMTLRPDGYIFGGASSIEALALQLRGLLVSLHLKKPQVKEVS